MAGGPRIAPGGAFTITLTGLPHHSPTPRYVALGLAFSILAIGSLAAFGRSSEDERSRRRQLEARRERVFGDLVRIEEQRRSGNMEGSRYGARRSALMAQLERIYGELDTGGRAAGGDEGLAA
jgi:hypothetical protein